MVAKTRALPSAKLSSTRILEECTASPNSEWLCGCAARAQNQVSCFNTTQMDDAATTRFHAALPYALLPISPSLSALHSVRVRSSSNSCQQCGCALHRGESSVRTVRSPNSRAIQTTCLICGWVRKVPLARGNAALFPRTRKAGAKSRVESTVHEAIVDVPEKKPAVQNVERHFVVPAKLPGTQQPSFNTFIPPKPRPKKKGGLQSMLERNKERDKERESREKKSGNGLGGGLAMFLNNL